MGTRGKKKKIFSFFMYICFRCTRTTEAVIYLTRLLPWWPWKCRFHSYMSSCHISHLPHQQFHIILTRHWNTGISVHFVINPLFLSFDDLQVLKGHDDHVITCLQFCGNRIVSGSDDNTLKVWSAVTGKVRFYSFIYLFSFKSKVIIVQQK